MLVIYKTVPEKTIRADCKKSIPNIETWFTNNPEKKTCRAGLWYGKQVMIRRGHVEEDMTKAMNQAIEGNKKG